MRSLRAQATNPKQYDNVGTDWLNEGAKDTPWRRFFRGVLRSEMGNLGNKSVLDVGCGTGWVSELVFSLGAKSYLGVEPSKRNFEVAKSIHENADFLNLPFEEFKSDQAFDLITCIMASEHLDDLPAVFARWYKLLNPGGRLIIIAGDLKAFTREKFDYSVKTDWQSNDEAVVHTIRPNSVDTIDIIRSPQVLKNTASTQGFEHITIKPLCASEELIKLEPKYDLFRESPIFQLLSFRT